MKKIENLMNSGEVLIVRRHLLGHEYGVSIYDEQMEFYDSEFELKHTVEADTIKDCLTCLKYELNREDNYYFQQECNTKLDDMIKKEDSSLIIRKLKGKSNFTTFMGYIERDFFHPAMESMEGGMKDGKSIEKIVEELNEYYLDMEIQKEEKGIVLKKIK